MNLRDQLKKARLLSDKDAKRLAHDQRVERKTKGREQLEQEQQQRGRQLQQAQQENRRNAAEQQQQLEARRREQAEAAAVSGILAQQARKPAGNVRFYFEAPDGSLPWIEIGQREVQELGARQLCIVRASLAPSAVRSHEYRLLSVELTRRVTAVSREAVVFAPGI